MAVEVEEVSGNMKATKPHAEEAVHHGLLWYCVECFLHRDHPAEQFRDIEREALRHMNSEEEVGFFQSEDDLEAYVRSFED